MGCGLEMPLMVRRVWLSLLSVYHSVPQCTIGGEIGRYDNDQDFIDLMCNVQ